MVERGRQRQQCCSTLKFDASVLSGETMQAGVAVLSFAADDLLRAFLNAARRSDPELVTRLASSHDEFGRVVRDLDWQCRFLRISGGVCPSQDSDGCLFFVTAMLLADLVILFRAVEELVDCLGLDADAGGCVRTDLRWSLSNVRDGLSRVERRILLRVGTHEDLFRGRVTEVSDRISGRMFTEEVLVSVVQDFVSHFAQLARMQYSD